MNKLLHEKYLFCFSEEAQKSLEVSLSMDVDDRHQLAMEMYRSRRISNGSLNRTGAAGSSSGTLKRNTVNRKSQILPNVPPLVSKSPPRPSPANVVYHSDEESLKDYDENPDDSSLTEKASEISSSDQVNYWPWAHYFDFPLTSWREFFSTH